MGAPPNETNWLRSRWPFLRHSSSASSHAQVGQTVKMTALEDFQNRLEAKLGQTPGPFPFQILSATPGIYVPNVGVILSNVVSLSYLDQPNPFRHWAAFTQPRRTGRVSGAQTEAAAHS